MEIEKPHIDQNALSRQLAVYGHEAQGKLMSLRVFIHGISGVPPVLFIARSGSRKELDPSGAKTGHHIRSTHGGSGGRRKELLLQIGTRWKGI